MKWNIEQARSRFPKGERLSFLRSVCNRAFLHRNKNAKQPPSERAEADWNAQALRSYITAMIKRIRTGLNSGDSPRRTAQVIHRVLTDNIRAESPIGSNTRNIRPFAEKMRLKHLRTFRKSRIIMVRNGAVLRVW